MRGNNQRAGRVGFRRFFNKNGAFAAQVIDNMLVVDDFMTDENRGAVTFKRLFNQGDGAPDPGAEAAGFGKVEV